MQLVRLTYYSKVPEPLTKKELREILDMEGSHNTANDITGFLFFNHDYIVQVLEGDRRRVMEHYHEVMHDKRLGDPMMMGCTAIGERSFEDWRMAYLGDDAKTRSTWIIMTGSEEFEPKRFTEPVLVETLRSMLDHLWGTTIAVP